ncbi:MAG: hypothetical protein BWZ08_01704 [candidate division BRC1 bacterium ADurb.BinA292]|nr:MAG: hypothetical protein BWZ08_01704 [candidate division BRC1 bacterium ADurb.BinA292]
MRRLIYLLFCLAGVAPAMAVETDPAVAFQGRLGPAPKYTPTDKDYDSELSKAAGAGLVIDTGNRAEVVTAFNEIFMPAFAYDAEWTGSVNGCIAGTIAADYRQSTNDLVNWFRAMAGLPGNVVFDSAIDARCQQAALMMLAAGDLSHSPGTDWACYTAQGAEAAGRSNLALGSAGPDAMAGLMRDPGQNNKDAGHRRWMLYPPQMVMGMGATMEYNAGYFGSCALWVIPTSEFATWGEYPAGIEWYAWPPPGYVPYQAVYPRWSFSQRDADFSGASVTMRANGEELPFTILSSSTNYGDPALVWELGFDPSFSPPLTDQRVDVTIDYMAPDGGGGTQPAHVEYTVIVIDPASSGESAGRRWEVYR